MSSNDISTALVIDFGTSHAQAAARRIRETGVYSEVVPRSVTTSDLIERNPVAVVITGDLSFLEPSAEGPADLDLAALAQSFPVVLDDSRGGDVTIMVGDTRRELPAEEFDRGALERVLFEDAEALATWSATALSSSLIEEVREQVGDGRVLLALSGGVDSSVLATLLHQAIGDRLTCVFVDHGLLREGEREQVEEDFAQKLGLDLVTVDAQDRFLGRLAGVTDPEEKRKIIGEEFIRVFEETQADLVKKAADKGEKIGFLAQGTIYPDIIESEGAGGKTGVKSHHNVGGLPDDLEFELVEPLKTLFKSDVRELGRELGMAEEMINRQPFPGPGLAVRIVGEVTEDRLKTLRHADAIVREELTESGMDDQIWQCPVVLLADVRSVGVSDEQRTYGHPIVLRPVMSEDAMTADWVRVPFDVLSDISTRITNDVPGVNRVVLDITPKPPATIEWE